MQQESTRALFQYWNRLRDGRAAPRRAEIEPADIKTLLADTFILEADMRGQAVFRLAGTRICAVYGRELKGFAFPSIWRNRDRHSIESVLTRVFRERTVATINYAGISNQERTADFEMLLLPLDAGNESMRCLGISTVRQYTYWLGADPVIESSLAATRVFDPDREPPFAEISAPDPVSAQADTPPSTELHAVTASPTRRVRHLLVLDGGIRS